MERLTNTPDQTINTNRGVGVGRAESSDLVTDGPSVSTTGETPATKIDFGYIRRLKVLPECPFDKPVLPPQHDFDGESLGA